MQIDSMEKPQITSFGHLVVNISFGLTPTEQVFKGSLNVCNFLDRWHR